MDHLSFFQRVLIVLIIFLFFNCIYFFSLLCYTYVYIQFYLFIYFHAPIRE